MKREIIGLIKTIIKMILDLIRAIVKLIYLLIKGFNNLIAWVYLKIPRIMRVLATYSVVLLAVIGLMQVIDKTAKTTSKMQIKVNAKSGSVVIVEDRLNTNETLIYNKAKEKGLSEEQTLIAIAISRHETGNWSSVAFNSKNNYGGIMCNTGLKSYSSKEEGLEAFINILKNYYFDLGLNTIDKIGAKYCPVGASNDPSGLNKNWIPKVSQYYKEYQKKLTK